MYNHLAIKLGMHISRHFPGTGPKQIKPVTPIIAQVNLNKSL